jgi:hypothetical protein
MALQFSTAVRNGRADSWETTIGTAAVLKIRSGAPPATCATADSGTVIATITLASDYASAAASGAKSLSGLPVTDTSADNTGTPGHFRLYASDGTTCHMQGTVTFTGSGGDMTVDVSGSITAGQQFSVTAFTITEGNG